MKNPASILVGNSFPFGLIRRSVRIEPISVDVFRAIAKGKRVVSFWGHPNTQMGAEIFLGRSLAPVNSRPVLRLSAGKTPTYAGLTFDECWVVSPEYAAGFRPQIGQEVPCEKINGWQILKITWE